VKGVVGEVVKGQAGDERFERGPWWPQPEHGCEIGQHGSEHEFSANEAASGLAPLCDQSVTKKIHGKFASKTFMTARCRRNASPSNYSPERR
jgi:hypothetical protein